MLCWYAKLADEIANMSTTGHVIFLSDEQDRVFQANFHHSQKILRVYLASKTAC